MDTIERRCESEKGMKFAEYHAQKADGGKIAVRRAQHQRAVGGSDTMLIWLGKNWLGQTDKQTIEYSGVGGAPIAVNFNKLSTDELAQLDELYSKAQAKDPSGTNDTGDDTAS